MWRELKDRIKLRGKLLKVSKTALDNYRECVRNMEHAPKLLIQKKLTRNVEYVETVLGTQYEKDGVTFYPYGNMTIAVKDGTVLLVTNLKGKPKKNGFTKNHEIYSSLSKKYLINID